MATPKGQYDDERSLKVVRARIGLWKLALERLDRGLAVGFERNYCEQRLAHWTARLLEISQQPD
jgi:hypothetical protein